ncbi:hypothetical protein BT96DRAFT_1006055 [Gymnopus androsaceus JB14]|uniref:Uncharacterized protein n=1 Tax=Gymnopus androsaceus JB14 TaxID=1447944 RepID=A0A6A4GMD0_9AGAR|nr:hypothetical protein BT96DRAFT_1006055 [Gymnopus androsaceus JB14]
MELKSFRRLAFFVLPSPLLCLPSSSIFAIAYMLYSSTFQVLAPGTDSGGHDESSPADNDGPIRDYLISSDFNFTDKKPDWLLSPPPKASGFTNRYHITTKRHSKGVGHSGKLPCEVYQKMK